MLRLPFPARFAVIVGLVAPALAPIAAHADAPIAPALATPTARAYVESELRALVKALPAESRARVTGLYVAFEANPNDANALAACDDDGDYVIVITDAMLTLVDFVAQARASDEAFHTQKQGEYAAFLAKDQTRGARLLPPPPGFFDAQASRDPRVVDAARAHMRDAIDGLLAHELAHVTAGDLACPHPTATRERGDAEWTRAEAQAASDGVTKIYTAPRIVTADATATTMLLAARETRDARETREARETPEEGYAAILAFFDQVPGSAYARAHNAPLGAASLLRAQVVRSAAAARREHEHEPSERDGGRDETRPVPANSTHDDARKKH